MGLRRGIVEVYTGNGKGKTTAALGLALRASGRGLKVYIIQFMKAKKAYGEHFALKKIAGIKQIQFGRKCFVSKENPKKIDVELARKGFEFAKKIVLSGKYDVVILDEISVAVEWNLIDANEVLSLMEKKPKKVELILTGRYAKKEIIEKADLVSEIIEVKHPFQKGMKGRKGIEA